MENKINKSYKEVTERFCPNINANAIIVRMVKDDKETFNCLSCADRQSCSSCEHYKKATDSR